MLEGLVGDDVMAFALGVSASASRQAAIITAGRGSGAGSAPRHTLDDSLVTEPVLSAVTYCDEHGSRCHFHRVYAELQQRILTAAASEAADAGTTVATTPQPRSSDTPQRRPPAPPAPPAVAARASPKREDTVCGVVLPQQHSEALAKLRAVLRVAEEARERAETSSEDYRRQLQQLGHAYETVMSDNKRLQTNMYRLQDQLRLAAKKSWFGLFS